MAAFCLFLKLNVAMNCNQYNTILLQSMLNGVSNGVTRCSAL